MCVWRLMLFCLLIPCSSNAYAANGDNELQRVNAIKAAFVLNIARFVTWPSDVFSSDDDPIRLCLYRDNVYGDEMALIDGKKIGYHRLQLTTIEHLQPDLKCEILLIPYSASSQFDAEFDGEFQQPILTIADGTEINNEEISRKGVIVTLVREGSRIAFEIDPWKAKKAKLHMSSELLKLAKIVGEEQ